MTVIPRRQGHRFIDTATGRTIDVWYPRTGVRPARGAQAEEIGLIRGELVEVDWPDYEKAPSTVECAYLRLHLLSERVAKPNEMNLEGIFNVLPIVAWTSAGPVLPDRIESLRSLLAAKQRHLVTFSIDRFPRMVDYVALADVRIADADRVRLGAHLAPGTTVMHEGFVNFNAGTLGPSMVEGRLTPGVVVGAHSDVGAGASIMGTLSGGGKEKISIGERTLLGANAGIGVSLGDNCVVEAGLYVTAGTKVTLKDKRVVAARELSGRSNLLFRRNSITGVVEALPTTGSQWAGLNGALHTFD